MIPHPQSERPQPTLANLRWRPFAGEVDFPGMLAVLTASKAADGIEDADSLEALRRAYAHLDHCDPAEDMVMVEDQGRLVGYGRVWWSQEEASRDHLYHCIGFIEPAWRRQGLGRALLHWQEQRLQRIAGIHPRDGARWFQTVAEENETAKTRLLETTGYRPVRYFFEMVRPTLVYIPAVTLPSELELRPVHPDHYRRIWEAQVEAFRDHWGFTLPTETAYAQWLENEQFQPDLWQVAWDRTTDQVAGMVLGFILPEENRKFGRQRGWTENICTARAWRQRGVAAALIAANLQALRARGMTEAALGVDVDNPSGALRLYERLGFRPRKHYRIYRKGLPEGEAASMA